LDNPQYTPAHFRELAKVWRLRLGASCTRKEEQKKSWPVDDHEIRFNDSVSPYLRRPTRTFAQACRDITSKKIQKWQLSVANENRSIYVASVRAHFDETP